MKNKILILFSAVVFLSASNLAMAKQSKIALVIGNSKYTDLPLKNPVNDAKDMKTALEKAGFTVIYATDATIDKMDEATNKFLNALDRDSLGLFFYSGHGIQAGGINYLIPVGAKISNEATLKRQSYDVNALINELEGVGNSSNILILDACRDNPYEQQAGTRSFANVSKGLARIEPQDGTGLLVAYATASGKTASDNQTGKNGLYTKYLKQYLFQSGLTVEVALKKVRQEVVKSNPEQIPWDNSSLLEDICLAGCTSPTITPTPIATNPPLLSFVSGNSSVEKNKTYTVNFKATDKDKDLSQIQIDWLDGSDVTTKNAVDGTTLSFTHNYAFTGIYSLIATALDKVGNASNSVTKSVTVKEAAVVTPVVKVPNVSEISLSKQSVIRGNEISFYATLNLTLPAGYSVKVNYGNGFETMNGSGKNFDLTAIPNASAAYKIGVYDSKNVLKSNQLTGNFSVSEPAPVVVVPPVVVKTTGYTKISNSGAALSDSAKLGSGSNEWACTKDNKTGLIWEVKTTDGGLRDMNNFYTNYTPDYPKCDWSGCETDFKGKYGDSSNTDGFVTAVNNQSLCGATDWRLPTNEELKGLVYCSDGKTTTLGKDEYGYICSSNGAPNYNVTTTSPTINTTYFPNTQGNWFWSSSRSANYSDYAWIVDFGYGVSNYYIKNYYYNVRLVRG